MALWILILAFNLTMRINVNENSNYKWSARKGNILTAINAFMKGAADRNAIEVIQPDKLHISPCKGCGVCQCHKGCVDNDDTNPTIDKIAAADMILFATPVYWWGMSAQLKTGY